MSIIQPRTLKGFRDYLPEQMMPREKLMDTARRVYRSYGYSPIDTPTLEYLEILQGKGSDETDKQLYKFTDAGGREVGMRFDLTVPLARFAAQHINQLGTPFKRYHIATVWRGEAPQRGRYREFMQCDFDCIGVQPGVADIETALVIHDMVLATGFQNFTIQLNNRKVLSGLLEKLGIQDQATPVLRVLDKIDKVKDREKLIEEMTAAAGVNRQQATSVLSLADISGDNDSILSQAEKLIQGNETGQAGIASLREITQGCEAAGVPAARLQLNIAIARGLDYYTGAIYETRLNDMPGIGSVCSGGRYDNLAALYTKQQLPGVGASLGLDRLLAAMEEMGLIEKTRTPAEVFIPLFEKDRVNDYLRIAAAVRAAGFGVEVYPQPKKLGKQLSYAESRGFRIALIAGERELADGTCQVKNMQTKESVETTTGQPLIDAIHAALKLQG